MKSAIFDTLCAGRTKYSQHCRGHGLLFLAARCRSQSAYSQLSRQPQFDVCSWISFPGILHSDTIDKWSGVYSSFPFSSSRDAFCLLINGKLLQTLAIAWTAIYIAIWFSSHCFVEDWSTSRRCSSLMVNKAASSTYRDVYQYFRDLPYTLSQKFFTRI